MKTILALFWKRRWCGFVGIGLIVCALPLLHPFIRQAIFGPRIDGIPWCYWEDEIRRAVHAGEERSWFMKALEKIGLFRRPDFGGLPGWPQDESFFPLYLHLADDADPKVRRVARDNLTRRLPKHQAEILPILRRELQATDPQIGLTAAYDIWRTTKEMDMKSVVLPFLDHGDPKIRRQAAFVLSEMAANDAELFTPLSALAEDADAGVREAALCSMEHFGRRGMPIIRDALRDPDRSVRLKAISAAIPLGKGGAALYPNLIVLRNDPDWWIRRNASHALYIMDPKQFPKPATWID